MKKLIIIFLWLIGITLNAQTILTISGQTYTFSVNIPRSVPTLLTFKNNNVTISQSSGAMIWAGDDSPGVTNRNLDNAVNTGTLCPTGWHVPTDTELKTLEVYLGMSALQSNATQWRGVTEGSELKNTTGWSLSGNGTNTSTMTIVPGGFRFSQDGGFYNLGYINYWWTATQLNATNAYVRRLDYDKSTIYRDGNLKTGGKSVRCIKN